MSARNEESVLVESATSLQFDCFRYGEKKEFYHEILGLEIALDTVIEDAEFSRGVGLNQAKVLASSFIFRITAA